MRRLLIVPFLVLLVAGCGNPATPDPNEISQLVQQAVQATLEAQPTRQPTLAATVVPVVTETTLPTEAPQPAEPTATRVESTATPSRPAENTATPAPSNTPVPTATATAAAPFAAASKVVNLRAGPGTNYPVVGSMKAGDRYDITAQNQDGSWLEVCCVDGKSVWVAKSVVTVGGPAAGIAVAQNIPPAPTARPAPTAAPVAVRQSGQQWTLVADAAADFPGGQDRNHWYYLWTEGRNNFRWQDAQYSNENGCYRDGAGLGLEICRDTIKADPRGDIAVQWKASRGGTYRFEWDSASLKFYQHANLIGIQGQGAELPYAATIAGVIDWEMFFWVAADTTPFHIRIFRLDETTVTEAALAAPVPSLPKGGLVFGDGTGRVGVDIPAGTYRSIGRARCYWERLRGFGGTLGEIIANDVSYGPKIVTISGTDAGFHSWGCNGWTLDLTAITASPTAPFGSGTYFVHKDIAPGTWQSSGSDTCYWERLSGFSGELKDILANDFVRGPTIVAISPGDTGFSSYGCGTWTRIQ